MSISQNIIDNLKNQGANPDLYQLNLINELCGIKLYKKFSINKIFFKDNNLGIYIWGNVGRGKTLITKTFISELNRDDIRSFHYIDLMNFIHDELKNNSGRKDPLLLISKNLVKNTSMIFVDEFQVEDVADAMIIGDLFKLLSKFGTKIILTSNAHPNELYKDGLQRQKFLSSIKIFIERMKIFNLNGEIDYRTRNIIKFDNNKDNKIISDDEIFLFIDNNFGIDKQKTNKIIINNRKFSCKLKSNNILWIEFDTFFGEPTSSSDFKNIISKFDWIFISNFKYFDDDQIDTIRRFISFIDIAYKGKAKIKFFLNEKDIDNIYSGSNIDNLWVRCKSRLIEMQTEEFLTNKSNKI